MILVFCFAGESNVYTLGNIGAHRIVCTKLPSVGHTREAMTAAGNTTTRLLGESSVTSPVSAYFKLSQYLCIMCSWFV
jgi:hypothetical protein